MKTEDRRANVGCKGGTSFIPHPSSLIPRPPPLRPPPSSLIPHPSGFTLIELLTVIAIIAAVAAMIVGVAGYATRKADRSRTMADLQRLANALTEYRVNKGSLPGTVGWSTNLTGRLPSGPRLWNTLLGGLPAGYDTSELNQTDPWGNLYWYRKDATYQFTLWSTGPDSLDASDDISTGTGEM